MRRYQKQLKIASLLGLLVLVVPSVTHADVIGGIIYLIVINLFGMLVGFGAILLNVAIDNFVIGFGGTFNNTGIGIAVNDTWAIIRDFVNLGFIFGLVYIGIKMILDADNANARRWLANLVLAALLVNFSLLATKLVVDVGNRLSAEIAVAGLGAKPTGDNTYKSDVGTQLMHRIGITSVFDIKEAAILAEKAPWGYIFGIAILFMIAAFVFAAGGLMLIIRFVALILYLIVSPIMFAGWIIPGIPDQMRKYWKDFLGKVFFAPIYLLFLYFSFQVIDGLQRTITGPGGANTDFANPDWGGLLTLSPQTDKTSLGTIPFFILTCALLLGSLKIASSLGKEGAEWSQKTAGKLIFGTVGRVGRNTLGRGANKIANSDRLKDMAANGTFGQRLRAQTMLAAAGKGAAASYDPRGVKMTNKYLKAGEAEKGGFKKQLDDAKKNELKRAKDLGEVDIDSAEGKQRVAATKAEIEDAAIKKKTAAEIGQKEFETDKYESEVTLTSAIQALTAEIRKNEQELADGTSRGILTDKDKLEREAGIEEAKLRLAAKQGNLEAVKIKDESLRQDKTYNNLVASATASDQEIAQARDAKEKAAIAYAQAYKTRNESLESIITEAEAEAKNAEKMAKGKVKYSRQIAYLEQKQNSFWNKNWNTRAGTAGGGALGGGTSLTAGALSGTGGLTGVVSSAIGTAGSLLGTGVVLGFSEAGAYGDTHKEIVKALEKEYGKDGSKKFNKDQRQQKIREEKAALKDDEKEVDGASDASKTDK